jgi:predicted transglutaminase-like cysteine proteinase
MKKFILLSILISLVIFSGCIVNNNQNDFNNLMETKNDISSIILDLNENENEYILKIYFVGGNSSFVKKEGILKVGIYDDKDNQLYYREISIDSDKFKHLSYGDGILLTIEKSEIKRSSSNIGRISIDFTYDNGKTVWVDTPISLSYLSNEKENINPQITTDVCYMTYTWEYKGKIHYLNLYIPKYLYDYYKSKKREYIRDYSYYVLDPYDDWYLNRVIQKIDEICKENNYNEYDRINLVISFVQQLPYTYDKVSTGYDEYPRYPIETLVDYGGDCEDTSILTAALLKQMGYDVALIRFPKHMGVGVNLKGGYGYYFEYNGKKYFYLETTDNGWKIGMLPDELKNEKAEVYPITEKPIYLWDWKGYLYNGYAKITVNIKNAGNLKGKVKVYCAFDAGNGYVYNPTESSILTIKPGEEKVVKLKLNVPHNKQTRLIVGLLDVNTDKLIDVKYSAEFKT